MDGRGEGLGQAKQYLARILIGYEIRGEGDEATDLQLFDIHACISNDCEQLPANIVPNGVSCLRPLPEPCEIRRRHYHVSSHFLGAIVLLHDADCCLAMIDEAQLGTILQPEQAIIECERVVCHCTLENETGPTPGIE